MSELIASIAIIAGTRPEIIKLAPLYLKLRAETSFKINLIMTGQHKELVQPVLEIFKLVPEKNLGLNHSNSSVGDILGRMIAALSEELASLKPDLVIVQGDTSSALAGALSAFHLKIPVAHVEAGLRTGDLNSPFPEELNRVLISKIAKFHFAPTKKAVEKLKSEGVVTEVHLTGNTGIDALSLVRSNLQDYQLLPEINSLIDSGQKFILSTFHRRENQEDFFPHFLKLIPLVAKISNLKIVIPVHLSPNVKERIRSEFKDTTDIILLPPLDYPNLIALMEHCQTIISDSGGIQEEAPSLNKYVFVTRTSTERPELLESGLGELLDLSDPKKSAERIEQYLKGKKSGESSKNPFGDGKASERIVEILKRI
jgi:UDP-N-acetylglucosamine 2-epimerase (non-hydrolysing)